MTDNSRRSLLARLRTAEGHLRSVTLMVEDGQDLDQILHQLGAVQAAVRRVQREILIQCVNESLEIIETEECPEKSSLEVERIYHLYRTHT